MKAILAGLLASIVVLSFSGCSRTEPTDVNVSNKENASAPEPAGTEENTSPPEASEVSAITLAVGEQVFSVALLDNETAKEFAAMLPVTLEMSELNGNEKYFYMDNRLSTHSEQPGQINAGDLMLYGDSCLVLFYDTFPSSYSYTQLGRVDDPSGLAAALGTGNVTVIFSHEGRQ